MPKYINADDIKNDIKTLWDWETVDGIKSSTVLKQVLSDIDNINEAVVRCEDCKFYTEWLSPLKHFKSHYCSGGFVDSNMALHPDDYCSYGERRESDGRA